ncbi:DNA-binding protein [Novosphingobium capsulatum]|nr:DNA-binding protein [Novosphingobium capsulatum]
MNDLQIAVHAGPPLPERVSWQPASIHSAMRVELAPGEDLFSSLENRLEAADLPGAFFNLAYGSLARLTLMTGGPGSDVPITFHGPIEIETPVAVEAGSGIIGLDENGARSSHCHAVFRRPDGRLVGGHLIRDQAIAGDAGLQVDLLMLADARFARRHDPETQFSIFHPERVR